MLDARIIPSKMVVTREVGGELVLLDLEQGTYFGLDDIGGRLWTAIETGQPVEELLRQLASEYDVPLDRLRDDCSALIAQLVENKLVSVER